MDDIFIVEISTPKSGMANFYFFIKFLMHYSRKKTNREGGGGVGGGWVRKGISRGIKERTCGSSTGQLKKK